MSYDLDTAERAAAEALIQLALREDLGARGDLTCQALVSPSHMAAAQVVSRKAGVLAGGSVGEMVFALLDDRVRWTSELPDGSPLAPGSVVATVRGPLHSLLMGERTMLNFMSHLSGVASLTAQYVAKVAGTAAQVLDTRKTLPGYRLLEKYAVRCGGGTNHRIGLYDGVLIKDNHLAAWAAQGSVAEAVLEARRRWEGAIPIEVEVDTLEQLEDALSARPEIVLLDNMGPETLRAAVALRDARSPETKLEASGGINLDTIADAARTGVERISVGALTHSAVALDLGFDWLDLSRSSNGAPHA